MKTTTKIVGAVVGVLLVAALFTGAVAAVGDASDNAYNLGDIEVWKLYDNNKSVTIGTTTYTYLYGGTTWTNDLGEEITFQYEPGTTKVYIDGDKATDGIYYHTHQGGKDVFMIHVKHIAAPTAYVYDKDSATKKYVTSLDGANVDVSKFQIYIPGAAGATPATFAWINPAGDLLTTKPAEFQIYDTGLYATPATVATGIYKLDAVEELGEYTVAQAIAEEPTPATPVYSSQVVFPIVGNPITFTLYNSDNTATLKALADEVLQNNRVGVTLEAPYGEYTVTVTNGTIPTGQVGVTITDADSKVADVTVGLDGIKAFVVQSDSTKDIKVNAEGKNGAPDARELVIKVVAGKITATATPVITNIGNEIDIEGTNELGGTLHLFMKGENYFENIDGAITVGKLTGKDFAVTLDTGKLNVLPDALFYTLYIVKLKNEADVGNVTYENLTDKTSARATISIKLVPSFINITDMPVDAVLGEEYTITGTAEGHPSEVMWYIFGNNYFDADTVSVDSDNIFKVTLDPQGKMEVGKYFFVVQHPMYNGQFNVGAVDDTIVQNKTKDVRTAGDNTPLLIVDKRQTTNAAYALCRAIEGDEDIDDMYVKRTFNVVEAKSEINPFTSPVAQGDALTISGTARGYADKAVSVSISTGGAFDATSKNEATDATASSFVEVTTVAKDGSWSVTYNTANIPVGEYKVTVKVGDAATSEEKDLKVVQGSAGPQPTSTAQPTAQPTSQPTQTPKSPGFGILAALAGLGAVAVLLLRRQ